MIMRKASMAMLLLAGGNALAAGPEVTRALFTYGVVEREPGPAIEFMGPDHDTVIHFTELAGLNGQHVVHEWLHDGQARFRMEFDVAGDVWRVHSSKAITATEQGDWRVRVLDAQGRVLRESVLKVPRADEL
ncbi:MAG: DUF2914 domain-containing protein [Halothiobacillaceae bacterium]|nr:MAG: DUF2914 domain-containing protein [Halothiobacillaceae bacterium]